MKKIILYRCTRPDGGVTVSPAKPDCEYEALCRLIADDGMELSNGTDTAMCVDTDTPDDWHEVQAMDDAEATEDDFIAALQEMGVEV